MKFRVDRGVLAEAVSWTARSIPSRPGTSPQLSGILLEAGTEHITLSGFDYETSARNTITADVADEGKVLVSGRLLSDICRALPDHPVDVALDGAKVTVTCGSSRFSLQTMAVEDYPELPALPTVAGTVDADSFSAAVAQAVTAAGRDDMLPVLTGVKLEFDGTSLTMLATDRFRLGLRELEWRPVQSDLSAAALVPAKVLSDVAKTLPAGGELDIALDMSGSAAEGLIGFDSTSTGASRRTTTRMIDGSFPNVRQLFPKASEITATVESAALLESVRRVALVAGRNTAIRLAFDQGEVTLEAGNGEEAQATESLEATVTGGDISIGFNPQYLLDGLTAINGSHVHIAMTQPGRPASFAALAGPDADPDLSFRYLLMPLRMQE